MESYNLLTLQQILEHNINYIRNKYNDEIISAKDSCAEDIIEWLVEHKNITAADKHYLEGYIHGLERAVSDIREFTCHEYGKRSADASIKLHFKLSKEYRNGKVLSCKPRKEYSYIIKKV